jgi:hypothetical protein
LSKGKAALKVVLFEKFLEEPGGDVESQATRKPFPEPAVDTRVYLLVCPMGLIPSLECSDLSFHGLPT